MLKECKKILCDGAHTCVIKNNDEIFVSDARGIAPLIDWIREGKNALFGAHVADKVIGKAAAMLMVYGGVKEVYAALISKPAIDCFNDNNVTFFCDETVDYIVNRTGDGMCPMEKCCLDIASPNEAYIALCKKLEQMRSQN